MSLLPELERAVIETALRHDRRRAPGRKQGRGRFPRRRWALLATGAGGLAVAGTVAALVIGANSPGRLDVVSEARAALAPQAGILHVVLTTRSAAYDSRGQLLPSSGQAALSSRVEQWSTKDPVRFRMLIHGSKEKIAGTDRSVQPRYEVTWANRTQTVYDEERRSMNSVTKLSPRSSASKLPAIPGVDQSLDDLRGMLSAGKLRDGGLVSSGGRELRRLSGRLAGMSDTGTVELDIDPNTFEPVRITTRVRIDPMTDEKFWTMVQVATVQRFEHLPLTPATGRLLAIRPPDGTTIVSRTLGEMRAYGRKKRAEQERRAREMKASGNYRGERITP